MAQTNKCGVCGKVPDEHHQPFPCGDATGLKPRNDLVLIRILDFGKVGSLATPNVGALGKEYHVVAFGPKVEDLRIGDKVLIGGQANKDWALMPNSRDLVVTREDNVLLVEGHVEDD